MSLALAPREQERLSPLERLELLCDPGSLRLLRTGVRSRRIDGPAGDGVLAGSGSVEGRPVFCFAQDAAHAGGSLGEAHAETVVRVQELAGRAGAPLVGFVDSAGARLQEGLAALCGYGRIFRRHVLLSRRVPQLSVVCGPAAGGGSYAPALTDFVVMAGPRASMFLTGPAVVADVTGERVDAAALGGPRVHERNGVCELVTATEAQGALLARELLGHLPQRAGELPALRAARKPPGAAPDAAVPREQRRVYDIRDVVRALADEGRLLELSPRHARNVVCALTRLGGHAVGVLANQPRHLGGVLDTQGSQKAARFVSTCDRLGVPLVVLVDTPGFLPGTRQEHAGVIRHGAALVHAFAQARVPRLTVVVRKAFGGAFIAMNSRDLGADLVLAWPHAQLGVMGAEQAVGIVERRRLAAAADPELARRRLAAAYAEEHLGADAAAAGGFVDEVVRPAATRARLVAALDCLRPGDRPLTLP